MGVIETAFGLAVQSAKGTTITSDAAFTYMLASQLAGGPVEDRLPLPMELSGRAMLRNTSKVGISTGLTGMAIPRADSIGWLLLALAGSASTPTATGSGHYKHVFTFDSTDYLSVPWFTLRRRMEDIWGEVFTDSKLAALTFNCSARSFVESDFAFVGILPQKAASISGWSPETYLDNGLPFLAADAVMTTPSGLSLEFLNITYAFGNAIPVDPQFKIGSRYPRDLQVQSRSAGFSAVVHVNETLYEKLAYDPGGGTDWVAEVFRDGGFSVEFKDETLTKSLKIEFNANEDNVAWFVDPIVSVGPDPSGMHLLQVTGIVYDVSSGYPYTFTLINTHSTQYA